MIREWRNIPVPAAALASKLHYFISGDGDSRKEIKSRVRVMETRELLREAGYLWEEKIQFKT